MVSTKLPIFQALVCLNSVISNKPLCFCLNFPTFKIALYLIILKLYQFQSNRIKIDPSNLYKIKAHSKRSKIEFKNPQKNIGSEKQMSKVEMKQESQGYPGTSKRDPLREKEFCLYYSQYHFNILIYLMYKELKNKVEEEKFHFEQDLQKISSLKKTPKVYQIFHKSKGPILSSSPSFSHPSISPQSFPTSRDFPIDGNSLDKIKDSTDIKQKDKIAEIRSQLDDLTVENIHLMAQNCTLREQLSVQDSKIAELQLHYKQVVSREEEKLMKLQSEYASLKDLLKETATKSQKQQQKLISLEAEHYDWQVKLQKLQNDSRQGKEQSDHLQTQMEGILIIIKQLNQSISTQIQHHQQQFQSLITDHSFIQSQIHQDKTQTENLLHPEIKQNIDKLHNSFNQVVSHNRLQQKQIMGLNHLISETLTTSMKYQRGFEDKENEVQKQKAKIKHLESQIKSITEERDQFALNLNQKKQEYSQKLIQIIDKQTENDSQLQQLKEQINNMTLEVESLKQADVENKEIISNLRALLDQSRLQFQSKTSLAETREQELITQINELKDEISGLLEEKCKNEQKINEHKKIEENLRSQIISFKQNLKDIVGEREPSDKEEEKIDITQKIEQQYQDLEASQEILKRSFKDMEVKLELMVQEMQKIQKQKESVEEDNSSKQNQIIELQEKIGELNTKNQNIFSEKQELMIKLSEDEAVLSTLKQETMVLYMLQRNYQELQVKHSQLTEELAVYRSAQKNDNSSNGEEKIKKTEQLELQDEKLKKQIYILSEELKNYRETSISEKIIYEQKVQELQQIILRQHSLRQQHQTFKAETENKNIYVQKIEEKYQNIEENLLNAQKQLEEQKISNKIFQEQYESMKEEVNNLHCIIVSLTEQLKNIEKKSSTPKKAYEMEQDIQVPLTLVKINSNCLKNNCDSVGIINMELRKMSKEQHSHLLSSPTDCIPFNTRPESIIEDIDELKLNLQQKVQKREVPQDQNMEDASNCEIKDSSHHIQESLNGLDGKGEKKKKEPTKQKRSSYGGLIKVPESSKLMRSSEDLDSKPIIREKQEPEQNRIQSHLSLEVNPDLQCGTLPYSQILKRYNNMKSDLEKMQEYINQINNTNSKIKKSIQEVDNYAHFKSIDKISQKFNSIIKDKETALKHQSLDFINEITALLTEIQSYIHFIDHLSKIEPFTEYHKSFKQRNKLKHKASTIFRGEKDKHSKKTYSQGQSPQDVIFEHFDANIGEYEDFNPNQHQNKELNKQEVRDIQRYFDDNKELYSQISSVKNKSRKSYNSFINSKSQIWQFGFHRNKGLEEEGERKVELEDEDKLGHMNLEEIKNKYYHLKEKKKNVMLEKAMLERDYYKKIQEIENNYLKKMAKMTKQFNQSFKVLCKASDNQFRSKKEFSPSLQQKEIQVLPVDFGKRPNKIQNLEKITIKVDNSVENNLQELQERIKEKDLKLKQKEEDFEDINNKLKILKKLNEDLLRKVKEEKIQPLAQTLKKNNDDFNLFMKVLASKIPQKIKQDPVKTLKDKETTLTFRKNSSGNETILIQSATPPKQLKLVELLQFFGSCLQLSKDEINQEMQLQNIKEVINRSLAQMTKKAGLKIVQSVTEYIKKFIALENDQEIYSKIEEIRLILTDYFGSAECVSELIKNTNILIRKLNSDSVASVDHLSVNSYCQDFRIGSDKEKQEDQEQDVGTVIIRHSKLKVEKQKFQERMHELVSEIKSLKDSNASRDVIIHWQEEEIQHLKQEKELFQKKKDEMMAFQKEKLSFQEELQKFKEKSHKKSKVIFLGH